MESPISDIKPQTPIVENSEKNTSSWLNTIAKWTLGMFLISILASFTIAYVFEDKIKARLVEEINNQLKTELTVESFSLSLLKGFPNVSAEFSQVMLNGTFNNDTAPLLEASNLSFTLPLFGLLKSNVQVKSVYIKDGSLSVYMNSKGVPNYKILKPMTKSDDSSDDFQLNIEQATLENIDIMYINKSSDITSRIRIDNASFSGNFSADKYALESKGNAESHFLDISNKRFIPGNQLDFDLILDIDMNQNMYTFQQGKLTIDDNHFNIIGDVTADPKGYIYDLTVKSKEGNLATVFTLLPEEYIESFSDITSTGKFLFDFTYKGQKTDKESPQLRAQVKLRKGEIKSPHFESPLKNVSLTANFDNGKYKTLKSSVLKISDFKGYFNEKLSQMELKISNLEDPTIDLEVDGTLPLKSIYKFFHQENMTNANGSLVVKDLKVKGKQNDMRSMSRISKVDVSGEIKFDKASLTINEYPFVADKGSLLLKNNKILVKGLYINGADSDARFSGTFKNLIPVMFADSTNSKNAELQFSSKLNAKNLDLDQLADAFSGFQSTSNEIEENKGWHSKISGFLDGTFDAYVENIHYNDLTGSEFEGSINFEDDVLTLDGDLETMDGFMSLEGELFLTKTPKLIGEIEAKQIDVHKFFKQAQNFGQETIVARNLKGKMNTNMIINAHFDENGAFLEDKLHVYAGLEIRNGELNNLEMLKTFSTYIHSDDLENIEFTKLENWFEIKNGKIHIPVMFIQSNAINLTVSGTHTFDHRINYNIKLNAVQVVANRIFKNDKDRRPQKDKRGGVANLHYTVKGTVEDYVVKRNKDAVQKHFKTSKYKKDKIRKVLEDSFGDFDLNSDYATIVKERKPVIIKKEPVKSAHKPIAKEVIQAQLSNGIPEFEVEEDNVEYIEFQGDDGD